MKIIFGLFLLFLISICSINVAVAKHCHGDSGMDRTRDADDRRNSRTSIQADTPYKLSIQQSDAEESQHESWQDALRRKRDNQN